MTFNGSNNPFDLPYTMSPGNLAQFTSNPTPMTQRDSEFLQHHDLENRRTASYGSFHYEEQFEQGQIHPGPLRYPQASYPLGDYYASQYHLSPCLTPSRLSYETQPALPPTHLTYAQDEEAPPAYPCYEYADPHSATTIQYGDQNANVDPHALYGQHESTNQIYLSNSVVESYPSPSPFGRSTLPYSTSSSLDSSEFPVHNLEQPTTPTTPLNSATTSTLSTLSTQHTPASVNNTVQSTTVVDVPQHSTPVPNRGTVVIPRPQKREKNLNSKLQKKLATKPGPVGDNRQVMGVFRRINADYGMWKERGTKTAARRAVYHSNVRAELIALDEATNRPYVQAPAAGLAVDDVTSRNNFASGWTSDRATVRDRHGNQVLMMANEPPYYVTAKPSNMIYNHPVHGELVVIDHNNHPVRHWRDVPRVISSEIEAWRIEALQRTVGVAIPDIRARMPRACLNKNGSLYTVQGPTALTNRTARWRKREGVVAWRRNGRRRIAQ